MAHIYWRIHITANNGDSSYTGITEIDMRASIGGADQCTGGTSSASTDDGAGWSHTDAFNDSADSEWTTSSGNAVPSWIQYQFTFAVDVLELKIQGSSYDVNISPKDFELRYSDNGTDWTTLKSWTGETDWGSDEIRNFVTNNSDANPAKSDLSLIAFAPTYFFASPLFLPGAADDLTLSEATPHSQQTGLDAPVFPNSANPLTLTGAAPYAIDSSMQVYKYWRIHVTANEGSTSYTTLAEIELRQSIGGADQCNGGIATADTSHSSYPPSNAFDNDQNTRWITLQNFEVPTWIQYTLITPLSIQELALQASTYNNTAPTDFSVQVSNNNVDWTILNSWENELNWADYEVRTFKINSWHISVPSTLSNIIGFIPQLLFSSPLFFPAPANDLLLTEFIPLVGFTGIDYPVYPETAISLSLTGFSPKLLDTTLPFYPYWRVYITANDTDQTRTAISEIEMRATVGGADQCVGGLGIIADSYYSWDYRPSLAFDDSLSTRWLTEIDKATPTWIQYEFTNPVQVAELILQADYSYESYMPKDFSIQASYDEINWEQKGSWTGETDWTNYELRSFALPIEIQVPFLDLNLIGFVPTRYFGSPKFVPANSQVILSSQPFDNPLTGINHRVNGFSRTLKINTFVPRTVSTYNRYKYWRVHVLTNNEDPYYEVGINEIEMRETFGGADQCNGGIATASTEYSPASGAFDGGITGSWYGEWLAPLPQWIQYEFLYPVAVNELSLRSKSGSTMAKDFTFLASKNGTDWEQKGSWTGETDWAYYETRIFSLRQTVTPDVHRFYLEGFEPNFHRSSPDLTNPSANLKLLEKLPISRGTGIDYKYIPLAASLEITGTIPTIIQTKFFLPNKTDLILTSYVPISDLENWPFYPDNSNLNLTSYVPISDLENWPFYPDNSNLNLTEQTPVLLATGIDYHYEIPQGSLNFISFQPDNAQSGISHSILILNSDLIFSTSNSILEIDLLIEIPYASIILNPFVSDVDLIHSRFPGVSFLELNSFIPSYAIHIYVSNSFDFDYSSLVSVESTFQYTDLIESEKEFKYEFNVAVAQEQEFNYDLLLRTPVESEYEFDYTYNIATEVEFPYSLKSLIAQEQEFNYELLLRTPVESEYEFEYTYTVSTEIEFPYSLKSLIAQEQEFNYELLLRTPVESEYEFDYTYTVSAEIEFPYSLKSFLVQEIEFKYEFTIPVESEYIFEYTLFALNPVSSEKEFIWTLISDSTSTIYVSDEFFKLVI